jgi:hypothetical protein
MLTGKWRKNGSWRPQEAEKASKETKLDDFRLKVGIKRGPRSTPNRFQTIKTERQDASRGLPDSPRCLQVAYKTPKAPICRQNSQMQGKPMVFQRFKRLFRSFWRWFWEVSRRFKTPPRRLPEAPTHFNPLRGSTRLQDEARHLQDIPTRLHCYIYI